MTADSLKIVFLDVAADERNLDLTVHQAQTGQLTKKNNFQPVMECREPTLQMQNPMHGSFADTVRDGLDGVSDSLDLNEALPSGLLSNAQSSEGDSTHSNITLKTSQRPIGEFGSQTTHSALTRPIVTRDGGLVVVEVVATDRPRLG